MTILPGTYTPTRPGHRARHVTHVTDTNVTFQPDGQPNVSHTCLISDFGVWVYIAQARRDGE